MAQDRHILCAIVFANAPIVFTKADIEDPKERLFHAPVFPHGLGETHSITGKRGQEIALFDRDRPAPLPMGLNEARTRDIGPRALHPSALDS